MSITSNYKQRKEDIEESFSLLDFLLSIETHRGKEIKNDILGNSLVVSQGMQCVVKAQFLMVLYNLVESTVYDCLNAIYDAILDDALVYGSLSTEMKQIWREYLRKRGLSEDFSKSEEEITNMPIHFSELAVNISGSLDYRKIQDVFSKHGCVLDDTKRLIVADSFLVVKNRRNQLAHGDISFSACGSNYMLSDLFKFKSDIVDYMAVLVAKTQEFIKSDLYKRMDEDIKLCQTTV